MSKDEGHWEYGNPITVGGVELEPGSDAYKTWSGLVGILFGEDALDPIGHVDGGRACAQNNAEKIVEENLEYDSTDEKVASFLGELESLCRRYGFGISACGCCGSPWIITESRTYDELDADVRFDEPFSVSRPNEYERSKTFNLEKVSHGFRITKNGKQADD